MKKLLFLSFFIFLHATEIEFGKGNFKIDFSLLGLNGDKTEKVTVLSILQRHKNIFSSKWFFSYRVSWFKSNTLTSVVNNYNSTINSLNVNIVDNNTTQESQTLTTSTDEINNSLSLSSATLSNDIRGLDVNIVLGRDIINKDEGDTYLGIGILAGLSVPYIKSSSDNEDLFKSSKTKITTYKVGTIIKSGLLLNRFMKIYSDVSYAYQVGKVKNEVLGIDSKSTGNNFAFDVGIKFQLKKRVKILVLTLHPQLFFTIGYRYDYWKVNKIEIESLNLLRESKLVFNISQVYFGLGYNF